MTFNLGAPTSTKVADLGAPTATKVPGLGSPTDYSYKPNGNGGLNYFYLGAPITNHQYGLGTGTDYGALEKSAADAFDTQATAGGADDGSAYDPNVGLYKGLVGGDQNTLNQLYAAITGGIKGYADDANNRIGQNFGDQRAADAKSYAGGVAKTDAAFGANGAYDSSFRGNADQGLTDSFNANEKSLGTQEDAARAAVGGTVKNVQSQLDQKPQFDLSQYTDADSLAALHSELGNYIATLRSTQQGLTPQGDLVKTLDSVVTPNSNLDSTVKAKLQALVDAGTPTEAQVPIATSYLTGAGITDPAQQKSYLDLLTGLVKKKSADQNPGLA
jgi:hypothetical protein